jgi:hypothetical protein
MNKLPGIKVYVSDGRLHVRGARTPEARTYVRNHAFDLWRALPVHQRFPKEEKVLLSDGRVGIVLQAFRDRLTVWPDGEASCIFVDPEQAILESLARYRAA